ncbi:MAG: preprotein translocase subunit SecD [Candidatus Methanospirare jalkutatii]|nr:MAG: preprotein translocase subunit SecD [Candidatus Methanospirare jalkutatii]UYZ40365.1 MAG: preprotein translocase subunit SecD [Candidatus Methanospirare jalkutatii]
MAARKGGRGGGGSSSSGSSGGSSGNSGGRTQRRASERRREGDILALLKDWRILLFLACVFAALLAIYVPSPLGSGFKNGLSGNLKYGLDLVGGSSLQVKLQGVLVKIDAEMNESELQEFLRNRTEAEVIPVNYSGEIGVFEIRKNITKEQLESILSEINASIGYDRHGNLFFKEGLTPQTVEETRKIIETKLNMLGLKSIAVRTVGSNLLVVDLAGVPLSEAKRVVGKPGKFEIRIQTEGEGGEIEEGQRLAEIRNITEHVLYGEEISRVAPAPSGERKGNTVVYGATFWLTEEGAEKLRDAAMKYGAVDEPEKHELVMLLDENVIYSAPLAEKAAKELKERPIYRWIAETGSGDEGLMRAKELIIHMRAGVLPVPVEIIASGEVPAYLGAKFKEGSAVAMLLALLLVSIIITVRYREKKIVLPIFFTLVAEVLAILGFAAVVGWQLDLPSIAGIIAVIGTGVDQLVMITDEVISGGKTASRIYRRRVSFAYNIIFASAATTIVAMLALASMALGTLRGFAIVTIVGLLIGIFVTRPAYARILEYIL